MIRVLGNLLQGLIAAIVLAAIMRLCFHGLVAAPKPNIGTVLDVISILTGALFGGAVVALTSGAWTRGA